MNLAILRHGHAPERRATMEKGALKIYKRLSSLVSRYWTFSTIILLRLRFKSLLFQPPTHYVQAGGLAVKYGRKDKDGTYDGLMEGIVSWQVLCRKASELRW